MEEETEVIIQIRGSGRPIDACCPQSFKFTTSVSLSMSLSPHTTPSGSSGALLLNHNVPMAHEIIIGFLLPSIHAAPPFFTSVSHISGRFTCRVWYRLARQQPNPATQAVATEQWSRLILSYARHRNLFTIRVEDAETAGSDWDEITRNDRINRTWAFLKCGTLLNYVNRETTTFVFGLHTWTNGSQQPTSLRSSKAINISNSILANTWRMGRSTAWMGALWSTSL